VVAIGHALALHVHARCNAISHTDRGLSDVSVHRPLAPHASSSMLINPDTHRLQLIWVRASLGLCFVHRVFGLVDPCSDSHFVVPAHCSEHIDCRLDTVTVMTDVRSECDVLSFFLLSSVTRPRGGIDLPASSLCPLCNT